MPLLLTKHPFPDAVFGLWQIAESEAFFRQDLPLAVTEEAELALHQNPLRRLEWLAGRWLLHKLTKAPQRLPISKDAFSKPFFPENQHLACSLSHSKGIVGALIVTRNPTTVTQPPSTVDRPPSTVYRPPSIGCDIQVSTPKMSRLAYKFLNESEQAFVESRPEIEYLELYHLYWTAKESLYKAYGLKELDFRKNMKVRNIRWDGLEGEATGRVAKGDFQQDFQLIFSKIMLPDDGQLITAVCQDWEIG